MLNTIEEAYNWEFVVYFVILLVDECVLEVMKTILFRTKALDVSKGGKKMSGVSVH